MLNPRIQGWRLAAGIAIWVLVGELVISLLLLTRNDEAANLSLSLLVIAAAMTLLGIAYWLGNRIARWFAVVAAIGFLGLVVLLLFIGSLAVPCSPYPECADAVFRSPMPWWAVLVPAVVLLIGSLAPASSTQDHPIAIDHGEGEL